MPFDVAGARNAGYTDEQINSYLASKQGGLQPQTKRGGSLWPLLGSIVGSIAGTPLGIPGIIGGGAIGGGLGAAAGEDDIVKEGALGGLGAGVGLGIGRVAGPLLGKIGAKIGQAAKGAGESFIASQYNVPRAAATKINFPQSIKTLADYGITDASKVPQIAEQVTGASGIISQITRGAVKRASNVQLGATQTGKSSILDIATQFAGDPLIPIGQDKKFIQFISKGIQEAMGGQKGTLQIGANPSEVFGFIQKLERQAASIGGGKLPTTITESERALKRAYKAIAEDLRERLFVDSGGDFALIQAISPQQLQALAKISPQLARNVANAKTIGELRGIAAPFVQANQAAELTEAAIRYGFAEGFGGGGRGLGRVLPSLADPLAPLRAGLSAAPVNAAIGGVLRKGIPFPRGAGTLAAQTVGQTGIRALGPQEVQAAESQPIEGQILTQGRNVGIGQPDQEQFRKLFFELMLRNPKQASTLKTIFEFGYPKGGGKNLTAAARDKLLSINTTENILNSFEQQLNRIGLSKGPEALIVGTGKKIAGTLRLSGQAAAYSDLRKGLSNILSKALGQVGNLSDRDIELAIKLIPDLIDTQEQAAIKIQMLRKIISDSKNFIQTSTTQEGSSNIPFPSNFGGF